VRPGRTKIDRHQEQAIAALLSAPTQLAAAEQVGISEATLQRWLREPAFQAAFRAARTQILERAVLKLQQATTQAVDALVRNLRAARSGDQIRAALGILDQAFKGAQVLDLQGRIEELERLLQEADGNGGTPDVDREADSPGEGSAQPSPSGGYAPDSPTAGGPDPDHAACGQDPRPLADPGPALPEPSVVLPLFPPGGQE
jgi:hypothetical protein